MTVVIRTFFRMIATKVIFWLWLSVAFLLGLEGEDHAERVELARIRALQAEYEHWVAEAQRLQRRGSPQAQVIRRRAAKVDSERTILAGGPAPPVRGRR